MADTMKENLSKELTTLKQQGLFKEERVLTTPQNASVKTEKNGEVLNFCSNNYLGLSNNPDIIEAAKKAMDRFGFGLSSVRFICGTQSLHKTLEQKVSEFLGTEDSILYSSAFDANGGVFEPLLTTEDIIISDELNHASIIDGIRLTKTNKEKYQHSDMASLEKILKNHTDKRYRLIVTDGVFSMDGDIADLTNICRLAEEYHALVMVDDSHATGYIGETGRGTPEYCGVQGRIDILSTTFGKALGGASGGCISGRKEIVAMLRQKSRPYLFSNTLSPAVAGGTLKALEILTASPDLRKQVMHNADLFKKAMIKNGFDIVKGDTAIVPVMLYDEKRAVAMSSRLLDEGIYVIGFTYPVVPKGKARIRVQLSAAHTEKDVQTLISAFTRIGKELKVIA